MKCEICGTPAVHICDLDENGGARQRSLCAAHAQEQIGFPAATAAEMAHSLAPKIRELAAFIRCHNRMPTRAEMEQLGCGSTFETPEPMASDLECRAQYFERLAAFIEREGRMPTEEELPDSF